MKARHVRYAAGLSLVALGAGLVSCQALGGSSAFGKLSCPELNGNVNALSANFTGDAVANGKIRTFVHASKDVVNLAGYLEGEIGDACTRIGMDLGMPPAALAARNEPGGRASGPCNAVSARIDAILAGGVQLQAQVVPPSCQVNAQAKAQCQGACQASVDPGAIVAQCEPGKLSGYCQGQCTGQCDGRCNGQCQGQCSQVDAQGRCVGQCQGTCNGSCDATCHAGCQGTWQAPQCEGQVTPPSADAECNASCDAHAELNASCSPAQVTITTNANAPQVLQLVASLQQHLPRLVYAQIALGKRLAGSIQVVGQVGAQLPRIVGNAGARGLACVAAAADASAAASVKINVSLQASASVTGKAGANL